jgi:hypothetical protein
MWSQKYIREREFGGKRQGTHVGLIQQGADQTFDFERFFPTSRAISSSDSRI